MWHAADGDLHAYLDGSLDVYAPSDAKRIRDHLESCAECKQRLVEETATAASARDVLAQATPSEIVAPPFEELRRRALGDAPPTSRARVFPLTRLAWAATVILALGIGWGVGVRPVPQRGPAAEEVSEAGAVPAAPEAERDQALQERSAAEATSSVPAAASPGGGGAASPDAAREQRTVEPRAPVAQSALSDARAGFARVDSIASALANAPPGARGEAVSPPAASFQLRASDFTAQGVRGGVAAARPATSTDSVVTSPPGPPVAPPAASPSAGRALGLDRGRITGLTIVAGTQAPMSDVQVYLVGQNAGALSQQNGQYVIGNVPPGTYELRAERIGMTTQSRQVTVAAGQNLEANFNMAEQALGLDEVVMTGQAGAARRREVGNTATAAPPAAPLSLPGVPISSVEWVEVASGAQGIRVVQGVDGVPVELYFVGVQLESADAPRAAAPSGASSGAAPPPSPAPPPDAAVELSPALMNVPLPTGWRQLARRFRGGLVIIRAPLSDARLRELLALAGAPLS